MKNSTFLERGHQKFTPILFLSSLHQIKVFHNFRKRGQRSIVENNMGLEYALLDCNIWVINN